MNEQMNRAARAGNAICGAAIKTTNLADAKPIGQTEVAAAMNRLSNLIAPFQGAINLLEERLEPVSRPLPPAEDREFGARSIVPMAVELENMCDNLLALFDQVNSIISRLEL